MRVLLVAAAFLAIALAGCSGSSPSSADVHKDVTLRDNSFSPATLSVGAGETVYFHNSGNVAHTVTMHVPSGAAGKDTTLQKGAETSYTFSQTGTYHVYCRFHSDASGNGMDMAITVS